MSSSVCKSSEVVKLLFVQVFGTRVPQQRPDGDGLITVAESASGIPSLTMDVTTWQNRLVYVRQVTLANSRDLEPARLHTNGVSRIWNDLGDHHADRGK